ncbi:hypothetical protein H0264_12660 [Nocardia huaxiensis]|uniref:Uncharacterized protein n=1 Tax=Nocardia huaxiensis TaxID=2755382 RepID=A0A7D6ZKL8_9NOCA|nr:hypothetical protein [Nocardia huaxiensis]QLY32967.1 hypothetical protein H0264_12660 [Nocardia huaxiensis]
MKKLIATIGLFLACVAATFGTAHAAPDPWVQDQIDWANCIKEHTAAECRAILNHK